MRINGCGVFMIPLLLLLTVFLGYSIRSAPWCREHGSKDESYYTLILIIRTAILADTRVPQKRHFRPASAHFIMKRQPPGSIPIYWSPRKKGIEQAWPCPLIHSEHYWVQPFSVIRYSIKTMVEVGVIACICSFILNKVSDPVLLFLACLGKPHQLLSWIPGIYSQSVTKPVLAYFKRNYAWLGRTQAACLLYEYLMSNDYALDLTTFSCYRNVSTFKRYRMCKSYVAPT